MTKDLYLFIIIYLSINAFAIIGVQIYLMLAVIRKVYVYDNSDYERLVMFLVNIKPLPLLDSISRYIIPFYGAFMSSYLIYLLNFDNDIRGWKISSKFIYAEQELQKFRIFKRKKSWKN